MTRAAAKAADVGPGAHPSGPDDPWGAFLPGPRARLAATGNGPLDGLRLVVQDSIDVAGAITGAGNPDWATAHRPCRDNAVAVDTLLRAGATLVGKTVMDELGISLDGVNPHYGAPLNPACPEGLTGGAASGAAAAVSAGLADIALGLDTGGSVRVPAALCGLWAFRPSFGRAPTDGVMRIAPSFDSLSWITARGTLMPVLAQLLLGEDDAPDLHLLKDLRFATDAQALAVPELAAALRHSVTRFETGEPIRAFPGLWQDHFRMFAHGHASDLCGGLGQELARLQPRLGDWTAQRYAAAMAVEQELAKAWEAFRRVARSWFDAVMPPGRVLALPTVPVMMLPRSAPPAMRSDFHLRAQTLASVASAVGAPQIHIPLPGGGLSLLARPGMDRALITGALTLAEAAGLAPDTDCSTAAG